MERGIKFICEIIKKDMGGDKEFDLEENQTYEIIGNRYENPELLKEE